MTDIKRGVMAPNLKLLLILWDWLGYSKKDARCPLAKNKQVRENCQ